MLCSSQREEALTIYDLRFAIYDFSLSLVNPAVTEPNFSPFLGRRWFIPCDNEPQTGVGDARRKNADQTFRATALP
jgi:hypothetical protein